MYESKRWWRHCVLQKGSSSLNEVYQSVHKQGCILVDFTAADLAEIYMVLERNTLFRVPVKENAVGYMTAIHYVLNIHYNKAVAPPLLFIQEVALGLEEKGKKTATYLAAVSALQSLVSE